MCPRATQHNVHSCYLMSCLANVPLSSERSRRLRCARLCLREGSAYTSFLRIHTQGSSRQSKLWGERRQHTHSVQLQEKHKKTHIFSFSVTSCLTSLTGTGTGSFFTAKPNPTCRPPCYICVNWDNSFSASVFLHLHVARHAGWLTLSAASDSRPENDQQTAVTRRQKSLLTKACLTLLIQAISSFYHACLSGFPPHPLATHVLTWPHINKDM